jgi:hypothetical protein
MQEKENVSWYPSKREKFWDLNRSQIKRERNGWIICIVARRPVAKWWLYTQRSLLRNGQKIYTRNNRRAVFSVWSVPSLLNVQSVLNRVELSWADFSWVQWSEVVGEWVSRRNAAVQFLWVTAVRSTGTVPEPRVRGTSAVRSRYQTTGEYRADSEN